MTPAQTDVERVAAALWRAETVDAGVPTSVTNARTLEAFADLDPDHRERFHKFARAAIAAMQPIVAKVRYQAVDALASYQQADMDGIMVMVSRQAIEECLPALRALSKETDDDNA